LENAKGAMRVDPSFTAHRLTSSWQTCLVAQNSTHDNVRRSYDRVADDYAAKFKTELASKPLDRALLRALVEMSDERVVIGDIGCGPGHVGGWLAEQGRQVVGIDLSPAFVQLAATEHPTITFRVGDFLSLPADDGEFGALVAFYSLIHLAPAELPTAYVELKRVLRPGGLMLASFHAGAETIHRDEWFDKEVDLDFHLLDADEVVAGLEAAGWVVEALLDRSAHLDEVQTRRTYLLARS
jgi:SAM-dependent methyltransferase